LIELLVVLAVIAVFVGAFATALRPGSPTAAVEGAQAQVASLLTQARGVATTRGANTRLIVHADYEENPDRFLRFVGIVYWGDTDDNGEPDDWVAATDGITLSNGVYFVPPSGNPPGGISIEYLGDWTNPVNPVNSRFSAGSGLDDIQYISNEGADFYFLEFSSRGLVTTTGGSPVLSVSTAQLRPDLNSLQFDNKGSTRGAILRQYGSFVLLNEPAAYPTD